MLQKGSALQKRIWESQILWSSHRGQRRKYLVDHENGCKQEKRTHWYRPERPWTEQYEPPGQYAVDSTKLLMIYYQDLRQLRQLSQQKLHCGNFTQYLSLFPGYFKNKPDSSFMFSSASSLVSPSLIATGISRHCAVYPHSSDSSVLTVNRIQLPRL